MQSTQDSLRPNNPEIVKPYSYGPESALVCAPDSSVAERNLYTDALGRIKVQFHWDRYGGKNQQSSCWVRCMHPWAGNQLGSHFLPRAGQEVVVDFIGGDPDLPICLGSVHNQLNLPPWQLSSDQALSGIRSRELTPGSGNSANGRSNHCILDDSQEQIQAQLKSDHEHSQLSLGHITRIEEHEGRTDYRGSGFELRSDGYGAIRSQQGLLISTEGRPAAQGHMLSMAETTARLRAAQNQHQEQGEIAARYQAQTTQDQAAVA